MKRSSWNANKEELRYGYYIEKEKRTKEKGKREQYLVNPSSNIISMIYYEILYYMNLS